MKSIGQRQQNQQQKKARMDLMTVGQLFSIKKKHMTNSLEGSGGSLNSCLTHI
jgi:hypothetical protein